MELFAHLEHSSDIQDRGCYLAATAVLRRAEGRLDEAVEAGLGTLEPAEVLGPGFQGAKHGVVDALEAALALGDRARAEELFAFVDGLAPGLRPPYLDAHMLRLRAREAGDANGLAAAATRFRALSIPFWLGVTLLEQAEALGDGAEAAQLRTEAREIFEQLGATPWVERAGVPVPAEAAV
jgi:hypothetical protein